MPLWETQHTCFLSCRWKQNFYATQTLWALGWWNLWPASSWVSSALHRGEEKDCPLQSLAFFISCSTSVCWCHSAQCCSHPQKAEGRGEEGEQEWWQDSSLGGASGTCQHVRQASIHPNKALSSCQQVRDSGQSGLGSCASLRASQPAAVAQEKL